MVRSPDTAAALQAGARLGRYECIRRIAVGGMAELYLGRVVGPAGFEKLVAIKRILPHRGAQEDFIRMFEQEARTAATLDHANVVKVMDFGLADAHHYLVMEYLHGRDLLDVQRARRGPLPLETALAIIIAVARGLHYVHERTAADGRPLGLVHRDISPSNIFLCYAGDVKVVDFGLAKATEVTMGTQSGALKGKLGYMSPEQCRGQTLDRRTDIHALGNILYGLTTGRRMYVAENEFALLNQVADGTFDPPTALAPHYPPALEAILLRATAFDRDARWPTAKALGDALEHFALDHGLRVGPSSVGDYLESLFGLVEYPLIGPSTSPALRHVTTRVSQAPRTMVHLRRRRLPIAVAVGGALVVGATLGMWLRPTAPPAAHDAPFEPAALAPRAPEPKPAPAPNATPEPEPEPLPTTPPQPAPSVVEPPELPSPTNDEPATEEAEPEPDPPPKTARRGRRRRPGKNKAPTAESAATKPAHSSLFSPPSKRD